MQPDTITLQPDTIADTTHSVSGYNQIQLQPDTLQPDTTATGYNCHRNGFFCNRIQLTRYKTLFFSNLPDTIATGYNCGLA